ncbi:DGQHR domain-containing protein [Bradyrhizobium sp. 49]|nr:DGQHR domain-containing protein [Bradyrhizobium sp. 84]MCK1375052.1 DGQHR domain-containing protein [Bradyrhizobium sp. 49]MCK1417927.1 DGQHR domain-containing protein [Bradyrhizobium sp. CW4]MCK1426412.1 DGQHR domain-containing protein [Bradyrhizobium sp. 87]
MPPDPDPIEERIPALRLRQPIGDIYIAGLDHKLLQKITYFDVRRVLRDQRDVEAYLGIQRPLNEARVAALHKYVNFVDATFPTSVILAIDDSDFAYFDEAKRELVMSNVRRGNDRPDIAISNLCRVIDGQHRIAGLENFKGKDFQVMTAIFVGIDIADQAYIFATVNLEQTKVRKSLAFDLFELSRTRSPYKTCHNVAVALDRVVESPLHQRIKRLGGATPGRDRETITQSTVVDSLVRYISPEPKVDRDLLLRGQELPLADTDTLKRFCLRNLFIKGDDVAIARIVQNYFDAVRATWPAAWDDFGQGAMLNKTNGFRALMSIFGRVYTFVTAPGNMVPRSKFEEVFKRSKFKDADFTTDTFKPGTSGEAKLRNELLAQLDLPSGG